MENKNVIAGVLLAGAALWFANQNGLLKAGAFSLPQLPGQTKVVRRTVPCPNKRPVKQSTDYQSQDFDYEYPEEDY